MMKSLGRSNSTVALIMLSGLLCAATARADTGCVPHVEENAQWQSAKLRPDRDGVNGCTVSPEAYQRVLRE